MLISDWPAFDLPICQLATERAFQGFSKTGRTGKGGIVACEFWSVPERAGHDMSRSLSESEKLSSTEEAVAQELRQWTPFFQSPNQA